MKIGTRGSELALWQARHVRALLQQATGIDAELVIIKTTGDKDLDTPFVGMTGKGFFTKEIEEALLDGRVDLAVHSLKDLQTDMPNGLMLGALPERADRRDVLLIRTEAFAADQKLRLKSGAKVGTSSARRMAQLRFLRPDLVVEPLRGNVPTRIRKLHEARYDAILVASAGLDRLELALGEFRVYRLPEMLFIPAPGQGVLALQVRADDKPTRDIVAKLDSPDLREIVYLERDVLRRLEGGCQLALGTAAEKTRYGYRLATFLGTDRPAEPRRAVINGTDRERILTAGVSYLKGEPQEVRPGKHTVWITREPERAEAFIEALSRDKIEVTAIPIFTSLEAGDRKIQDSLLSNLTSYDWVMFTSQIAVREFRRLLQSHHAELGLHTRIAAVGMKTAVAVGEAGWKADFIGDIADALSSAEQFAEESRGEIRKVLFPCSVAASDDLEAGLSQPEIQVDRLECYDMRPHIGMRPTIEALPDPDVIVFTSPQAARFLLAERPLATTTIAVSIGPSTSETLLSLGCPLVYEALDRSLEGTAEVTHGIFAI